MSKEPSEVKPERASGFATKSEAKKRRGNNDRVSGNEEKRSDAQSFGNTPTEEFVHEDIKIVSC